MVAVITGNATANLMRAVPNEGVCAAGADACAAEVMVCLPSGAMDCLHVSQLRQSGCAAEHKGGSKAFMRNAAALHDAPSAVAGSACQFAWEGSAELDQHQVNSFGRDLQHLGPERHGDQRTRQEQLHQLRQL